MDQKTAKKKISKEYREGFLHGKLEIIEVMNQTMKIFWEVWKTSSAFKLTIMKDIYNSLNKRRPSFLDEIIVTGYEHRGPAPKIYDIKHLTPYLC